MIMSHGSCTAQRHARSQFARVLTGCAVGTITLALCGCTLTPEPLSFGQLEVITARNLTDVTANQEAVHGAISLHEAMARAVKYNLDYRVEMMQAQLRQTELRLAHYGLLPSAVVNSGYSSRNNDLSSGERNIFTGAETAPRTTSTDRNHTASDLAFSWNVLDFGLSYVRARQSADKVLIAEEAKRKVMHRIIEDTRTAYWRAVSSDRMIHKLKNLEVRVRTAQSNAKRLSRDQDASPITALTYERELIEIKRTTQQLQHELSVAKTQLAALMNLRPGADFELAGGTLDAAAPVIEIGAQDMIAAALLNRAELRDIAYQQRINDREASAALLELLPGIQLYAASNHDTNHYLMHKEWVTWCAKASWNLVRTFQYPAKRGVIEGQDKLLNARALALTMAVMTQVHVSRIRYANMARELQTSRDFLDVQTRLVRQMRHEAAAGRISEQTLIREELNSLVAEAKRDIAFAGLQSAFANVFASVGLDPYASDVAPDAPVADLAAQIKGLWFERGDFGAHRKLALALR
jgi:outer membrane protein TolC